MSNQRKVTPVLTMKMKELREQGLTYKSIARELKLSGKTVEHYLNPVPYQERLQRRRASQVHTRVNGVKKVIHGVNKPSKPDSCQVCERSRLLNEIRILAWHHWDDVHPEKGLWLCPRCHTFAWGADKGLYDKYMGLKEEVEIHEHTERSFGGPESPVLEYSAGDRRSYQPSPA